MDYKDGKQEFILSWGELGVQWGITRTMAQIHALLLISPYSLSLDDIMEELLISKGNAHTHIKTLMDWNIVYKDEKRSGRKDYYWAEKDIWKLFKSVLVMRKQKELDPMIETLDRISSVNGVCSHSSEFCKMVRELKTFSIKADHLLDNFARTDNGWLSNTFMKMIR